MNSESHLRETKYCKTGMSNTFLDIKINETKMLSLESSTQ